MGTMSNSRVNTIFVHYTAGPVTQTVAQIRAYHKNRRGWSDIAYHWLVDQWGNLHTGRGWGKTGAATYGHNSSSYAICWIGDAATVPSGAALSTISRQIDHIRSRLGRNVPVKGHRDVRSTSCPGDRLYSWVKQGHNPSNNNSGGVVSPRYLRVGVQGEDVREWQKDLQRWNPGALPQFGTDSHFGAETDHWTREFQTVHGLTVDGIVGPESRRTMAETLSGVEQPSPVSVPPVSVSAPAVPPYPGLTKEGMNGTGITRAYQQRLWDRGWRKMLSGGSGSFSRAVDDWHGKNTTGTLRAFQAEKHLQVDGIGGPETWKALWETPIT